MLTCYSNMQKNNSQPLIEFPDFQGPTLRQVDVILRIMREVESVFTPREMGEVPEEAVTSAESTYIRCCNVLDNILDDVQRFDVASTKAAQERYMELLAAQKQAFETAIEVGKQQITTSQSINRPSTRLNPTPLQIQGRWVVAYGDLSDLESCLTGQGDTLAAAMDDFDKNYFTTVATVETVRPIEDAPAPKKRKKQ